MSDIERKNKNYAIIGGGSTGPLQLYAIAKEALAAFQNTGLRLDDTVFHLIDPNGFGNGGIAYGQCSENHKLNSDPNEMDPHNRGDHIAWRGDKGLSVNPLEFNARAEFLPFLQDQILPWAIETLRDLGASIQEHQKIALPTLQGNGLYDLNDEQGTLIDPALARLSEQDFVCCTGYGHNENFAQLQNADGYIHNIYSPDKTPIADRFPLLQQDGLRIAVIGAGPGLYDFINDLTSNPSELIIYSRSGERLGTRDPFVEKYEESQIPNGLLALTKTSSLSDAQNALQAEFNDPQIIVGRSSRRIALDINRYAKDILHRLPLNVAQDFRKSTEFRRVSHLATPAPAQSQRKLDEHNPEFIAARMNGNITAKDNGGFTIQCGDELRHVDIVVNVTGHGCNNSPAADHLKAQGLAAIDDYTGAIATHSDDYRLKGSNIALIGPDTHVGTHGVESFYPYCEKEAKSYIQSRLAQKGLQPAANAPITPPTPRRDVA